MAKPLKRSPVIADIADFDRNSGSFLEMLLFNNRPFILISCLIVTVFLGFEATRIKLNADYEAMIPTHQPFIVNFINHYNQLQGQGNAVRIVVAANKGTIINKQYLSVLQHINDQVFLLSGVNRGYMVSLWTPATRWLAITSVGLAGGPVIDQSYDGSAEQLDVVRQNIENSGQVGNLVALDFKSSTIYVPLLQKDDLTGKVIDYGQLARELNLIRTQYDSQGVTLHIVGFGMVVGDMINDINEILAFFVISIVIAAAVLYWYTRCVRSTLLVVTASLIAVVWQMGLLPLLGYDLTPYSALVPFLIFAIGMSHGAQKMNGVMQDIGRGTHPLVAARYTFRRLFLAGFAALTCDATSFAVLMTIQIQAIRELAMIASLGVAILIFTNLIMLPMLLSYTGVSKVAAVRSVRDENMGDIGRIKHPAWDFLDLLTQKRYAGMAIAGALLLGCVGYIVGQKVQVGDVNQGAPELRQSSQYNKDNAYVLNHYATGSDTFVIIVDTPVGYCTDFKAVQIIDSLEWQLDQLPQVKSTSSIASFAAKTSMLLTENSPKWNWLNPGLGDYANYLAPPIADTACSFVPIYVSLSDHKSATLDSVVSIVQHFIADPHNQGPQLKIELAGGNAGIEAATNIVIRRANVQMLYLVYAAVIVFCFVTFRSWRAVICAVLPLILTSILSQALMVLMHIGIKVATLPVIALGVGIGVDYALYVLSICIRYVEMGESLSYAYHRTLLFTGRVVLLTGFTLAAGVVTWIFAPIRFQADMGLLLAFMFLWNMFGALVLLPALATFLLKVPTSNDDDALPIAHERDVAMGCVSGMA